MQVITFRQDNKGYRIGKFDLLIPKWGNCIIEEISFFQKENKRWISFPSYSYEEGELKKYKPYISFQEPGTLKLFQAQALKALDEYFQKNNDGILDN